MKTDKINMIINFSILGLLIYLAVAIKDIHKEVVNAEGYMKPAMVMGYDNHKELEYNIRTFLNNVLQDAIKQQESNNG
jgi:hypothetical protein